MFVNIYALHRLTYTLLLLGLIRVKQFYFILIILVLESESSWKVLEFWVWNKLWTLLRQQWWWGSFCYLTYGVYLCACRSAEWGTEFWSQRLLMGQRCGIWSLYGQFIAFNYSAIGLAGSVLCVHDAVVDVNAIENLLQSYFGPFKHVHCGSAQW